MTSPVWTRFIGGEPRNVATNVSAGSSYTSLWNWRLVDQEHGRLAHDGARERDPLPFAAGELARLAREQGADAEQPRRPRDPLALLVSSQVRARFGSAPLSAARQKRRSRRPQVERGELAHVRVRRKRRLPPFDHPAAQAPTAALATAPRGRGFLPARVP